jgi:hypothetical protein
MGIFSKVHRHHSATPQPPVPAHQLADMMFLRNEGPVKVLGAGHNGRVKICSQGGREREVDPSSLSRLKQSADGFQVGDKVLAYGTPVPIDALSAAGQAVMCGEVTAIDALERPVDTFSGFTIGDRVLARVALRCTTIEQLGERGTVKLAGGSGTTTAASLQKAVNDCGGFKVGDHALNPSANTKVWKAQAFSDDGMALWHYRDANYSWGSERPAYESVDKLQRCVSQLDGLRPGDRVRLDDGNFGEILQVTAQGSVRVYYIDREMGESHVGIFERASVQRMG